MSKRSFHTSKIKSAHKKLCYGLINSIFFFLSGTQNNCLKMDGTLDFMKLCWQGTHYALETYTEPNKLIKKKNPPNTKFPQNSHLLRLPRRYGALAAPDPFQTTQRKVISLVWGHDMTPGKASVNRECEVLWWCQSGWRPILVLEVRCTSGRRQKAAWNRQKSQLFPGLSCKTVGI